MPPPQPLGPGQTLAAQGTRVPYSAPQDIPGFVAAPHASTYEGSGWNADGSRKQPTPAALPPGALETPGFGETNVQNLVQGGMPQTTGAGNTQNQFFQDFQGQIGQDPGLGAYYDRAKERAAGSINQQLAARGSYGSSVGLGQLSDAMSGIDAQRAQKEADYMLNQQALGGQLANQAGSSMLNWTQGLGGLGLAGDQTGLGRNRLGFDQLYGLTSLGLGAFNPAYDSAIQGDQGLFESGQNINMGQGALGSSLAADSDQRFKSNAGLGLQIAGLPQLGGGG